MKIIVLIIITFFLVFFSSFFSRRNQQIKNFFFPSQCRLNLIEDIYTYLHFSISDFVRFFSFRFVVGLSSLSDLSISFDVVNEFKMNVGKVYLVLFLLFLAFCMVIFSVILFFFSPSSFDCRCDRELFFCG